MSGIPVCASCLTRCFGVRAPHGTGWPTYCFSCIYFSIPQVVFRCQHVFVYVMYSGVFIRCPSSFFTPSLTPCSPLPHVTPNFVSCADLSTPVAFPTRLTHPCRALTFPLGDRLTFLCDALSVWPALVVAATGSSYSIHLLHPSNCQPARGGGILREFLPVCRLACDLLLSSHVSVRPLQVSTASSVLSSGLFGCMHFSRVDVSCPGRGFFMSAHLQLIIFHTYNLFLMFTLPYCLTCTFSSLFHAPRSPGCLFITCHRRMVWLAAPFYFVTMYTSFII